MQTMDEMIKYPQIDKDKVDIVKDKIRKKSTIWFSFLLLGWSYGSLGKLGLQFLWYAIPFTTGVGIYQNLVSGEFTLYTAFALIGFPLWVIWSVVRILTLNKAVDKYNDEVANFFGLNPEEKNMLGIES